MMRRTSYKPRPPGTLKDATDELVSAVGGVTRAADLTRVSPSGMARYTDPAERDRHMPADVIRALEARASYPILSAYLAREAGFELVRPEGIAADDVVRLVAGASRSATDVINLAIEALEDMQVDADEAGEIVRAIDQAQGHLTTLRVRLRALMGEGEKT